MNDTASLEIRVLSDQVQQAIRRLDDLEASGKKAARATDGLTSAFQKLAGPLLAVVSSAASLNKLVDVQREFDILSAGLVTATGSAKDAAAAFEALQDFAATTPYDLQQVTESFTKLINYGLTPSERALTSYGDTAAAMGRSLEDMIEAVADATTGEFERLKGFGIRTQVEGDRIKFTFRGITTEVGRNAKEIEEYLIALGENNFAGNMAARMATLDGAISNLGDEWNKLFLNLSQMGVGGIIEDSVRLAISALEELNALLASGEMEGYLSAIASQWSFWGEDVTRTATTVTTFLKESFKEWENDGDSAVKFLIDAFQYWPANVRAFIQIITVEIASLVDRAAVWGRALADNLNPFNGVTTLDDIRRQIDAIGQARLESIDAIMRERDAAVSGYDAQVAAAKEARKEYEKAQAARRNASEDRLARYKVGGGNAAATASQGTAGTAAKKRQEEFARLVEALRTEEEAIQESYEKRKAIIEANTAAESEIRADLMARLDRVYNEQLTQLQKAKEREIEEVRRSLMTEEELVRESYERRLAIIQANTEAGSKIQAELVRRLQSDYTSQLKNLEMAKQRERDMLWSSLMTEEEMLSQAYERKKALILESSAVTEMERQDLLRRLEEQFAAEQRERENQRVQMQLATTQQLFSGLSGLAKAYSGEQSKIYRVLFAISKAYSTAQAALALATGLAKALELGYPASMAAMAKVSALGSSILSKITSINFAGFFDKGGAIPAGKIGIVGEYGPEIVEGPAKVTSRAETAKMLKGGEAKVEVPPPVVNIRNINVLDPSIVGDYLGTDDGERIIMNIVQRNQRSLAS